MRWVKSIDRYSKRSVKNSGTKLHHRRITKDNLERSVSELSNPSSLIDNSFEIISNLSDFWGSGDYHHKRKLQELLFPGGIQFDRRYNNYRTSQVSSILTLTRSLSNDLDGNKTGKAKFLSDLPGLVVPTGIVNLL